MCCQTMTRLGAAKYLCALGCLITLVPTNSALPRALDSPTLNCTTDESVRLHRIESDQSREPQAPQYQKSDDNLPYYDSGHLNSYAKEPSIKRQSDDERSSIFTRNQEQNQSNGDLDADLRVYPLNSYRDQDDDKPPDIPESISNQSSRYFLEHDDDHQNDNVSKSTRSTEMARPSSTVPPPTQNQSLKNETKVVTNSTPPIPSTHQHHDGNESNLNIGKRLKEESGDHRGAQNSSSDPLHPHQHDPTTGMGRNHEILVPNVNNDKKSDQIVDHPSTTKSNNRVKLKGNINDQRSARLLDSHYVEKNLDDRNDHKLTQGRNYDNTDEITKPRSKDSSKDLGWDSQASLNDRHRKVEFDVRYPEYHLADSRDGTSLGDKKFAAVKFINKFDEDRHIEQLHAKDSDEKLGHENFEMKIAQVQRGQANDARMYDLNDDIRLNEASEIQFMTTNPLSETFNFKVTEKPRMSHNKPKPDEHLTNRYENAHLDDLHSDGRAKDHFFEKNLFEPDADRQFKNLYSRGSFSDKLPEIPRQEVIPIKVDTHRQEVVPTKDDYFRPTPQPNRNLRLNLQYDERAPVDSYMDRRIDVPKTERKFHPPGTNYGDDSLKNRQIDIQEVGRKFKPLESDDYSDNLQKNRRFDDKKSQRFGIDQESDKNTDADIHPDRRLSNDDFDRYNPYRRRLDQDSSRELDNYHQSRNFGVQPIHYDDTPGGPRRDLNLTYLMNHNFKEWEDNKPKLNFPKKPGDERYRMATLHLDKGLFVFEFLTDFLLYIQPRGVPLDILKDAVDGRIDMWTLVSKTFGLEWVFISIILLSGFCMLIVPCTECYLCCKIRRYNKEKRNHGGSYCFLAMCVLILGSCVATMMICNQQVSNGIEKIPDTLETVLEDLRDYHAGSAGQLRKSLTRSLDVASEAILGDLDNVDDLLGKPIQSQLASETGVDMALEQLLDVANASSELAYKVDGLLKRAERARELGEELGHEVDEMRRELEGVARDCGPEDRSLCAVLDPSGLHLSLRLDRVARDDRLVRLRQAGRDNLTELGRQARGEYLFIPHHIDRTTLEARNKIRREINSARGKISDEARNIEATGSDVSSHLDQVRRITNDITPYIHSFEDTRWLIGFGTAASVFFIWLLLTYSLCCKCGSSEKSTRRRLLWFVFFSCFISILCWSVFMAALTLASHTEMILCRPLDDPEFRTVEAIIETKYVLGRRLSVPLKDLFDQCEEKDASFAGYQLDNNVRLEQLTAHWTWSGLTRAFASLRVDLTSLRILPVNLRDRLQNLLYASGANLTEHRVVIQGPILNKDLNALSDQVENVARQLADRRTARNFQNLATKMRDTMSRRVKPLMKLQDELVYHLATLELHMQPLQHEVNQTLALLRNVQYFLDIQGEKIGQLKAKAYIDRLGSYLDQWRAHVLVEISSGASKCRPLWDILRGIKLLLCGHILSPLNGYWFALFICSVTLLLCTPMAHKLASSYYQGTSASTVPLKSHRGSILLPHRQGSPDTLIVDRDTWRTPNPPSSMESW